MYSPLTPLVDLLLVQEEGKGDAEGGRGMLKGGGGGGVGEGEGSESKDLPEHCLHPEKGTLLHPSQSQHHQCLIGPSYHQTRL